MTFNNKDEIIISSRNRSFARNVDVALAFYPIHSSFIVSCLLHVRKAWEVITPVATAKKLGKFDTKTFLSTIDRGRKIRLSKKQAIFVQGYSSDAVFYIQKGKVRLTARLRGFLRTVARLF